MARNDEPFACFALATGRGQTATVRLVQGPKDDVAFNIVGVVDNRESHTFKTAANLHDHGIPYVRADAGSSLHAPGFREVKILVCGGTRYSEAGTLDSLAAEHGPSALINLVAPSEHIVAGVLRILSRTMDELTTQDQAEFPVPRLCAQVAGTARSIPIAHAVINRCFA